MASTGNLKKLHSSTEHSRSEKNSRATILPSKISFVPGAPHSDLYGAVNCAPTDLINGIIGSPDEVIQQKLPPSKNHQHQNQESTLKKGSPASSSSGNLSAKSGSSSSSKVGPRLKLGPPLLEIRRFTPLPPTCLGSKATFYYPPEDDDYGASNLNVNENQDEKIEVEDKQTSIRSSNRLFHHETLLVSRGIPGLGGNVSSTCLDFRPLSERSSMQQNQSSAHPNQSAGSQMQQSPQFPSIIRCATGLTSGALCIHTISNLFPTDESDSDPPSSTVAHYAPRQQRPATSVAWRPSNNSTGNTSRGSSGLVAIGLVGSGSSGGVGVVGVGAGSTAVSGAKQGVVGSSSRVGVGAAAVARMTPPRGGIIGVGGGIGSSSSGVASGDRDFGCLVWDIEHQSSVTNGSGGGAGAGGGSGGGGASASAGGVGKSGSAAAPIKTPSYRFAHNSGVESLSWLSDGQILAVGCQKRNVQLYDLRVAGTNAPPISVFAHSDVVSGIAEDINCPTKSTFATFGTNAGEPVKIWDARKMHGTLGEIRVGAHCSVSAIAWSTARHGILSVAIGDSIGSYDTRTPGSRALPVGVSYMNNGGENSFVQCLAYQPQLFNESYGGRQSSVNLPLDSTTDSEIQRLSTSSPPKRWSTNPFEYYPHRTLVVSSKGLIEAIPEYPAAPIAISKRDGRIAYGLGGMVCIGPTTEGPSAMEGDLQYSVEDVSAKMMRRARCLHAFRYSTNAGDNVRILEQEKEELLAQHRHNLSRSLISSKASLEFSGALTNLNQLLSSWRWISLVEHVCLDQRDDNANNGYNNDEPPVLPAKGLLDAGVMKLLKISSRGEHVEDSNALMESKSLSESLKCDIFDSPMRRAAINACGWTKKYGVLRDLLEECESRGAFERSAALAIWHGDIGECVAALQRGAEDVRALLQDTANLQSSRADNNLETYAETLNLIAMCVAGFNVTNCANGTMKSSPVWSSACESLLRRPDISETATSPPSLGVPYLRAICTFLLNIGQVKGFSQTIFSDGLSLADRVAFACRYLSRTELRAFLDTSLRKCLKTGNLEGLLITGLDKRGIGLLQSYVDRYSDVQTAALISCRAVLPTEWAVERRACTEWLDSYRVLLNNWQMWHSRAAFDVGRCDHLRRLKGGTFASSSGRRGVSTKKQFQIENELSQSNFPPQLWARCNYCNSSLSLSKLRRQEGIANSWLSRQKPVLTCCPQCKKPLPRCSICLLSMGCLNPYMELQRERNQYPRGGMAIMGAGGMQGSMEDLSGLANIPFAEWFTWCMRCKHGGHAHHLVGWFSKHSTCAVSGCDCRCQFDGIEKLCRPGSSVNRD